MSKLQFIERDISLFYFVQQHGKAVMRLYDHTRDKGAIYLPAEWKTPPLVHSANVEQAMGLILGKVIRDYKNNEQLKLTGLCAQVSRATCEVWSQGNDVHNIVLPHSFTVARYLIRMFIRVQLTNPSYWIHDYVEQTYNQVMDENQAMLARQAWAERMFFSITNRV